MRAIYVDKHIPRALLTKFITPYWADFVWTPFSAARAGELPDVPLPGPRWLRVKNLRCGICASDLSLLFVHADPSIAPAALPGLSRFWLGHETVSVVTEVGPGVTRFRVGDRVLMDTYFAGANCETLGIEPKCRYCKEADYHFCVNKSEAGPRGAGGGFGDSFVAHESEVYPAPGTLSLDQAMLVEPISIAMHGVMRFPPQGEEKVLVIGAGIIGLLTTMVIHALVPQAEITVLARYPHQQQMAEKLGAKHILTKNDYQAVARLTGGKYFSAPLNRGVVIGGFDKIYDCVADPHTTNDALRWVRAGGTVVMIGAHMAPMPKVDLTPVWYHHVHLVGTYGHGMSEWQGVRKHTYEWVFDQFGAGRFNVDGLITHRFPLKEYKEAIRVAISKGREKAIKVAFEHE
ncbi:MAG TPA: alcohol dehydrogenase catalytic domain-containing protein [Anaerolineales bacterium]|nr:alcohol dehydrogenase catalytic domain-containing protein [Anaerolineales bacterium]